MATNWELEWESTTRCNDYVGRVLPFKLKYFHQGHKMRGEVGIDYIRIIWLCLVLLES